MELLKQINENDIEILIDKIVSIKTIDDAKRYLFNFKKPSIRVIKALEICIQKHSNQFRKSGEPYSIHPILVACIVSFLGGDDDMIISALLHDVVEDTDFTKEEVDEHFGDGVATIVEGLTKITNIREDNFISSQEGDKNSLKLKASALSFRKMILISIEDLRVLVVKLCDRLHNMLTLDALREDKQKRISQETLLVYAPIAHRLGIAFIKNFLEDLSFKYLLPKEYELIDNYLNEHKQQFQITLNRFSVKLTELLLTNGFLEKDFEIQKRIKHYYSIYLKMQRKGISIQEVLDLLAVRIIVKEPKDCYLALGIIHTNFNPLIARFKDYIALPKQNGYKTIHTTIFSDANIIENQIRTYDMHKIAEFGIAAHWKYKYSGIINPKFDWLSDLTSVENSPEELYEYAKDSLYIEDIAVYSPMGGIFTLPRGATALDYAYEIHSQVGLRAIEAYVNRVKVPLLTELKNGDIVHIITGNEPHLRCSWLNSVKTGKARAMIKNFCKQKLKEINKDVSLKILETIFNVKKERILNWIEEENLIKKYHLVCCDEDILIEFVDIFKKYAKKGFSFGDRFAIKEQKFDNIVIASNQKINGVGFDYCCNPKRGDNIISFKDGNFVYVHHKFCERALNLVKEKAMVFSRWRKNATSRYKIILNLENKRGSLAEFLSYLVKLGVDLISIRLGENDESPIDFFEVIIEMSENLNTEQIKTKLKNRYKIIEFASLSDAYK